jgi:hypothetical protein
MQGEISPVRKQLPFVTVERGRLDSRKRGIRRHDAGIFIELEQRFRPFLCSFYEFSVL